MLRTPESEVIAEMQDVRQFNEMMGRGLVQREYRRLARDVVQMGVPPGGRVLDIGTGPGFVAIEIAKLLQGTGCQVTGLDLSSAMLTVAAENAARAGLNGVLTWREGDAKDLPFEQGEFDAVVSSGSLHHWDDPLAVLDEIARVLKKDGHCVVRDSRRLQRWGPKLFAWAIGLTIPRDFRVHYWGSIRSSYTPGELREIIDRSRLGQCEIHEDMIDLMVVRRGLNA